MTRSHFELSKWYMDCVSPDGDALIAYSADLSWRRLRIGYESALEVMAHREPAASSSLKPHGAPVVGDSAITWDAAALGLNGVWRWRPGPGFATPHHAPPIRETIYQSDDSSLEWSCLMPSGAARIKRRSGTLDGCGYVEHLRMTVPPWRLPITSLRWGRIATEDDAIFWIQWIGDFETTIAYSAGVRVAPLHVDDQRVALADGTTAEMDCGRVLRRGALGATVLSSIPALRKLAPLRILATEECKWLSRARVTGPGRAARETWAIHELVTWPQKKLRGPA